MRSVGISAPIKAPNLAPVPIVPSAGLLPAMKYALAFARARWQRRGAIRRLRSQIKSDTSSLEGVLAELGKQVRSMGLQDKVLDQENSAIDTAEVRKKTAEHECSQLSNRLAEEMSAFANSEAERTARVSQADDALKSAQQEYGAMETQQRDLRDQRKSIEGRQKGYLKAADGRDGDAEKQEDATRRQELRSAAVALRRDAELLAQERQDIERRYDALGPSLAQLASRVDALKSDRDAAKQALSDLREAHRLRIGEIDAEQGRKSRELAQAVAEIERRFITLGTLANLNRLENNSFCHIYEEIDTIRGAIGARSNQIDKMSAERQAFDRSSLIRGAIALAGGSILVIALVWLLIALT